jgi:hypothetical protein
VDRILSRRAPTIDAAAEHLRTDTRQEMERIFGGGGTGKAHAPHAPHEPRKPRDEQRARANRVAAEIELERALTS